PRAGRRRRVPEINLSRHGDGDREEHEDERDEHRHGSIGRSRHRSLLSGNKRARFKTRPQPQFQASADTFPSARRATRQTPWVEPPRGAWYARRIIAPERAPPEQLLFPYFRRSTACARAAPPT